MRAAIFIDAGYLLKLVQEEYRGTIDYQKFADYLLKPIRSSTSIDLLRCYFYYCPPYMSPEPTAEEQRRWASYEKFEEEIEAIDRWQYRKGKLEKRRDGDKMVFSQKRVDVMLSVDLVRHAAAGHIQHAILVAGDSDFVPAIAAAKESGVTISVWCGKEKSAHKDLKKEADEVCFFNWSRVPMQQSKGNRAPESTNSKPEQKKKKTQSRSRSTGKESTRGEPSTGGQRKKSSSRKKTTRRVAKNHTPKE